MNKKIVIPSLSVLAIAAGTLLLWFDYTFFNFGQPGFGRTQIVEGVKTLYLAIFFITVGLAGFVWRLTRR